MSNTFRYLAAKGEADHYAREMKREQEEIVAVPETGKTKIIDSQSKPVRSSEEIIRCNAVDGMELMTEAAEVAEILAQYGIEPHEYSPVVNSLRKNPQAWLEFMMRLVFSIIFLITLFSDNNFFFFFWILLIV